MKRVKVHTRETVNNFVDSNTGELLETSVDVKHTKITVLGKEDFVFMYAATVGLVDSLDKTECMVLFWSVMNCGLNTNEVSLAKHNSDKVQKEFGLAYSTVKNAISRLKTKGVLIGLGSGQYRIHPHYFWRGHSNERGKVLNYVLEVECPDCI